MKVIKPIEWIPYSKSSIVPGYVKFIDQTLLPHSLKYVRTQSIKTIYKAIKTLQIRGAPAIGIAAAMGIVLSIQYEKNENPHILIKKIKKYSSFLSTSRPTAVNLFWALKRIEKLAFSLLAKQTEVQEIIKSLASEAIAIRNEDAAMCHAIGKNGASLLKNGYVVLTHCNAGALATAEFGTALAPIYQAVESGLNISVYADETRPLLQGSRLTAWELHQAKIPVTVICDNTAAFLMQQKKINIIFVGADRIASNGDTANKIGTYSLAVLAKKHNIPFYVCAPTSTIDPKAKNGNDIPIEERKPEEVIKPFGIPTAPAGIKVYSPAFDITPANLITAIICEKGILWPNYKKSIAEVLKKSSCHQRLLPQL